MVLLLAYYPPANTLGEPAATEVQPAIASPTLPVPTLFVITVVDPTAMGAECGGHGTPGNRCVVFTSPCLDTGNCSGHSATMGNVCVTNPSHCWHMISPFA